MRRSRSSVLRSTGSVWRWAVSAGALAALAACSTTSTVVHLHSLMPGALSSADARVRPGGAPLAVVLDPVRMPSQVDQPQWLVRLSDGSLATLEQERWASPVRDEFRQAVLETLIVRYGVAELRNLAARDAASGALRVDIDVRRFESVPGEEALIEGSWTVRAVSSSAVPALAPAHCEWLLRERSGAAFAGLAQAHRRAVARLADGIGAAMLAIKRGAPPSCPPEDGPG